MTSKEQERKAVEQIRKIVAGLGENSYVGMAMEGALEDAEQNIEYDFGCSYKQRYETEAKALDGANSRLAKERETSDKLRQELDLSRDTLKSERDRANKFIEMYKEACNSATENWNKLREQEEKNAALEQQILVLKAKLYDYMTAQ